MVSKRALERLEEEMILEEEAHSQSQDILEALIIDIPDVTDIQENTAWIVSEEVKAKVIETIKGFPGGQIFIARAKIKIAGE